MRCFYLLLVTALLAGCDSATDVDQAGCDSETELDQTSLTGSYDLVFIRIAVGGQTVLEGLAGVYTDEVLTFEQDGALTIDYLSDLPDEEGRAEGRYSVEGKSLAFYISTSSTPLYPADTKVRYDRFATLKPTFCTTYEVDGQREFTGPGLVLEKRGLDSGDLDRDGDRSEVQIREYFYATSGTP